MLILPQKRRLITRRVLLGGAVASLLASPAAALPALVSHQIWSGSGASSAINTTGAKLLYIVVGCTQAETPTISDSAMNSWTAGQNVDDGAFAGQHTFYCDNPTTSASHTFTVGGGGVTFQSAVVGAFSGILASGAFDQHTQNNNSSSATIQPGAVMGSNSPVLKIVTNSIAGAAAATMSLDSSFILVGQNPFTASTYYGSTMFYLSQTTAASDNPTCTLSSTPLALTAVQQAFLGSAPASSFRSLTITGSGP